ncbi:MAG: hypothetical protein Kow00108_02710 [Calditrichia bacterium]
MNATLNEIPVGNTVKIIDFQGGIQFKLRLSKMGLSKGMMVKVKRNAIFSGPVVVETMGREIALGRGVAERIIVEKS